MLSLEKEQMLVLVLDIRYLLNQMLCNLKLEEHRQLDILLERLLYLRGNGITLSALLIMMERLMST